MSGDRLVLAATDRLARSLREDYALDQRRAGQRVWRTPHIASLDQWVADLWVGTWPAQQLISTAQALALWLHAIEKDSATTVLAPLATAREALRAEQLLLRWKLDAVHLPAGNEEQRAWLRWRRQVRARMQRHGWLLRGDLLPIVTTGLASHTLPTPESIELHGFNGTQPTAIGKLLDALAACCHVDHAHPEPTATTACVRRLRVVDPAHEFRHVAAVVRERLNAVHAAAPPRIAIVVPDLQARRELLDAALVDLVAPLHGTQPRHRPWRWEAGRPAAAWPWIDAATTVFAVDLRDMDGDTISNFLLAPPLWEAGRRSAAATLDYRLRRIGHPRQSFKTLCSLATDAIKPRLTSLLQALESEPARALPSAWAQALQARLGALGWPGDAALPSIPFQCLRELQRRLARLAGMDAMLGAISLGAARRWLNELLRGGFEPRVEYTQPISILAPEDAAGLPCELMIICDASTDAFPGHAQPSPFLPLTAQRQAGIPEAFPATHLAHCRELVAALLTNTREAEILIPAVEDSGAEVMPSPLFGDGWSDAVACPALSVAEKLACAAPPLTLPQHDPVPPVSVHEQLHGDARLFEEWAESPFFAFCTHRLGIERLPQPERGLNARDQGIIMHDGLRRFWQAVKTRDALLAMDDTALADAIAEALAPKLAGKLPASVFSSVLVRMETARLQDILRQWLQHEMRRAEAFEVVLCEVALDTELAGLPLSLIIDRIDRVATQHGPRWLVLDYKTGRDADHRGWNEDSLRAPQLPLYAVVTPTAGVDVARVDGIGFAHLKDGHPALSTASNWCLTLLTAGTEPKRDWDTRVRAWAATLERWARAFMAGEAGFDPARVPGGSYNAWLLPLTGCSQDEDTPGGDDA